MKEKNFSEIYNEIYADVGKSLEKNRKVLLFLEFAILFIFVSAIIYVFSQKRVYFFNSLPIVMIVLAISFFVYIVIVLVLAKKYAKKFKETVVKTLVEKTGNSFRYEPRYGLSQTDYYSSGFDKGWDKFNSEDYISGSLENNATFQMSQVETEEVHITTDGQGHTQTTYVTTFLGVYGILTIPTSSEIDIKILNNSKMKMFNKSRIEMESSEFEKYYDVFTNDGNRQGVMELLTPETIESLTKIRNNFKKAINIRIINDKIYFRIPLGDVFEPPTLKSSVNFDLLQKYFRIIDLPRTIYEALIDNIIIMSGDTNLRQARIDAQNIDLE